MLKITDSTGKVVGVLKDEDTSPEMKEELPQQEDLEEEEGEEEDASTATVDVC